MEGPAFSMLAFALRSRLLPCASGWRRARLCRSGIKCSNRFGSGATAPASHASFRRISDSVGTAFYVLVYAPPRPALRPTITAGFAYPASTGSALSGCPLSVLGVEATAQSTRYEETPLHGHPTVVVTRSESGIEHPGLEMMREGAGRGPDNEAVTRVQLGPLFCVRFDPDPRGQCSWYVATLPIYRSRRRTRPHDAGARAPEPPV